MDRVIGLVGDRMTIQIQRDRRIGRNHCIFPHIFRQGDAHIRTGAQIRQYTEIFKRSALDLDGRIGR